MSGPLAGIRIIDASNIVSGPMATSILGDQGADVIKIEQPGIGDLMRYLGMNRNGFSGLFAVLNRSKRSITINVSAEQGRNLIYDLVRNGDAFIQNYRPGVADRMGIGYEQLRKINPDLVYVSISGFGDSGPYRDKRVYDPIIQGVTGYATVQGDPATGKPQIIRTIVCDKLTSLTCAQAITAGLLAKARGQGGQHVRLSMMEAALQFLWHDAMANDILIGDGLARHPLLSDLYQLFETKDGYITSIAVTDSDWQGFCRAVGRQDLLDDARFKGLAERVQNAAVMMATIAGEYKKYNSAELLARLDEEDVPCGPVNTRAQIETDPQVVHQASIYHTTHPVAGPMRSPRPPIRFGAKQWNVERHAPLLGQQTDEVLREVLGKSVAEIKALREAGAVG